jgi:hypothetical protein
MDDKFYLTVGTDKYFPLNPTLQAAGTIKDSFFASTCTRPLNSSVKLAEEVLQSAVKVEPASVFCEAELVVIVGTYMSSFIFLLVIPNKNPFEWVTLVGQNDTVFTRKCRRHIENSDVTFEKVTTDLHLTTGNAAYLIKNQNAKVTFERIANIFNKRGDNTLCKITRPPSAIKASAPKYCTSIHWKALNQDVNTNKTLLGGNKLLNVLEGKLSKGDSAKHKCEATNLEEYNCSKIDGAFEKFVSPAKLVQEWENLKQDLQDIPTSERLLAMGYTAAMIFCDPSFRMNQMGEVKRNNWDYIKAPTLDLDQVSIKLFFTFQYSNNLHPITCTVIGDIHYS